MKKEVAEKMGYQKVDTMGQKTKGKMNCIISEFKRKYPRAKFLAIKEDLYFCMYACPKYFAYKNIEHLQGLRSLIMKRINTINNIDSNYKGKLAILNSERKIALEKVEKEHIDNLLKLNQSLAILNDY